MRSRRGAIVPGIILVLLGLYFLANQLNIPIPSIGALWPGFVVLGGVIVLVEYGSSERRDREQLFAGIATTLIGVFFFFFTLHLPAPLPGLQDGVEWADMGRLWPVFVLIAGLAALGQWLARPDSRSARNTSLLFLAFGLVALALNFSVAGDGLRQIVRFWPVLLIVLGLAMLWRRRPSKT